MRTAFHPQIMTSRGFEVDEDLVELIETIWDAGYVTGFSCSGDLHGIRMGYIQFKETDHVIRHKLAESLSPLIEPERIVETWLVFDEQGYLYPEPGYNPVDFMLVFEQYPSKPDVFVVRFDPVLIPDLVAVFRKAK